MEFCFKDANFSCIETESRDEFGNLSPFQELHWTGFVLSCVPSLDVITVMEDSAIEIPDSFPADDEDRKSQPQIFSHHCMNPILFSSGTRALLQSDLMRTRISIICFILCSFLSERGFAMRLVVQKVKSASVTVEGTVISSIGPGVMALVGLHEHDTQEDMAYCCKKLLGCKLWENDNGALWRHGVKQKSYEVNPNLQHLCISR